MEGDCTVLRGFLAIDSLKTWPSVHDQRTHRGWNGVVFLLYLHYRLFTGEQLCLEVWELCALFCQSKRQVGDKQNSLENSDCVRISHWVYRHSLLSTLIFTTFAGSHGHCFLSCLCPLWQSSGRFQCTQGASTLPKVVYGQ